MRKAHLPARDCLLLSHAGVCCLNRLTVILPDETDAGAKESMLYAIITNLRTTNKAFGQIEGIPSSITDSIDQALNSLTSTTSQAKAGASKSAGNDPTIADNVSLKDLKEQLTSNMAATP